MRIILLCLLALVGAAAGTWLALPTPDRRVGGVECPSAIDLGEVQEGELAEASFTVTNKLDEPFNITRFNPGCGCISLLKQQAGRDVVLEKETLQPGESLKVKARIGVQGNSAGRLSHVLRLFTDLPDRPEIAVEVRGDVRYGIYPDTKEISFGEIIPGRALTRSFRLVDARMPKKRQPLEARSTSHYVTVKGVERVGPANGSPVDGSDHYQVTLDILVPAGGAEQVVQGAVELFGGQEKPLARVVFAASVRQPMTLTPTSLVLRGGADAGAESVLRSEAACRVRVVSAPDGLRVRISPSEDRRSHTIRVEFDTMKKATRRLVSVGLEAECDGESPRRFELQVLVPSP